MSENLIPSGSDCPAGYAMDPHLKKCLDVDECDTGDADCDMESQVCRNEAGSYKCVDIMPPSSDCEAGFRFNVVTESCEGMYLTPLRGTR